MFCAAVRGCANSLALAWLGVRGHLGLLDLHREGALPRTAGGLERSGRRVVGARRVCLEC
ncbi:hypothetical protein MICRO8M_70217 [Microbacterium sp. 8M]|nr:hypothetical protein MICRO8M_70217 [Microbacterium sp. 8M]